MAFSYLWKHFWYPGNMNLKVKINALFNFGTWTSGVTLFFFKEKATARQFLGPFIYMYVTANKQSLLLRRKRYTRQNFLSVNEMKY